MSSFQSFSNSYYSSHISDDSSNIMSHSQPFSYSYHSNHVADDSSTVFDAETVTPDEVPSLPAMPQPTLTATATTTDYLYNNINESTSSTSIQEESPQSFTSVLLRRINSQRSPAEPSTTTATATRSGEISTNQFSSSSSSKKRSIITNSSSHSSRKKTRQRSRLDKSDSEVDDDYEVDDYEPDEAVINQSSSSQTSTTKLTKYELKWRSKFEKLCEYKRSNGNVNVPRSNKQLGQWVQTQRHEYKNFKANKKAYITEERIQKLESIGFEWVPNKGRNESKWNERFNELKAYKEEYKDTNVPQDFKDNKQLGQWVSNQRTDYRNFQENRYSPMTSRRIEMLNSIGFEWVNINRSKWNKRFTELKDYKEKYGRTNVPYRYEDNKKLGKWVSNQRSEYKKFQENKKSQITPERIEMLNSIGFQWECRPSRAARS